MNKVPNTVWTDPIHFVACGFGVGAVPVMPGTVGTLLAIPIYLVMQQFPTILYVIVTLVFIVLGIYICGKTNHDFGTTDHPAAVWDEIACFPIVMFLIPVTWYFIVIGFVLFRVFDIFKPWPICWCDKKIGGGVGVMLDDVIAALFSWIILYGIYKLFY